MSQIKSNKKIELIDGRISDNDLFELYKIADCFVLPSHGEGFGMPAVEAMVTGLPVIITNWMGTTSFAKEKYCYPIEINYLQKAIYASFYGDVGYWAYIDTNELKRLMRKVYNERNINKDKCYLASEFVENNFRFKHFMNRLNNIKIKNKNIINIVNNLVGEKL